MEYGLPALTAVRPKTNGNMADKLVAQSSVKATGFLRSVGQCIGGITCSNLDETLSMMVVTQVDVLLAAR